MNFRKALALNRIAEQKAAELRAQGKPVPKPGQYVLSEARPLSEGQLLERFRSLGLEMDRERLGALVATHCSAQEIPRMKHLKLAGAKWGEWRTDDHQSIVPPSIHPDTLRPYTFLQEKPVATIRYEQIIWPEGINAPRIETDTPLLNTRLSTECEESVSENRNGNPSAKTVIEKRNSNVDYDRFVAPYVAHQSGYSDHQLGNLGRLCKLRQAQGHDVNLRSAFAAWWSASAAHVDKRQTADTYWDKFCRAVEGSRGGILAEVWTESEGVVAPGAEVLWDDRTKRLAAVCYVLQLRRGDGQFILPCRQAAELFAPTVPNVTHVDTNRWMHSLVRAGLVKVLEKGIIGNGNKGSGKAAVYQYIGGANQQEKTETTNDNNPF